MVHSIHTTTNICLMIKNNVYCAGKEKYQEKQP